MVVVIYTVRVYLFVAYRPKIEYVGVTVKSPRLKTPSVIIANHTSMWDPLMMLAIFFHDRSIVVAKDQIEDPHFSWALTRVKCVIPCDRFNLDTEWALIAKKELERATRSSFSPKASAATTAS